MVALKEENERLHQALDINRVSSSKETKEQELPSVFSDEISDDDLFDNVE